MHQLVLRAQKHRHEAIGRVNVVSSTQVFADQLIGLESSGKVEEFVSAVFATNVELVRPETGQRLLGHDGARTFWEEYLARFNRVHSTFSRVSHGEVGVLEWASTAQLLNGTDISYTGVSLLDFDEQGMVCRFSTYYDTRVFQPAPK